jgi:hypothetical protein
VARCVCTGTELISIGRRKTLDRGIRLGFCGVRFSKVFDLGRLSVFHFAHLAKDGYVEWLADIHAGRGQFIKKRPDMGDNPSSFCFAQDSQASHNGEALTKSFPSGLALIHEKDRFLLFGQCDGLAFSQMESRGQLINEHAITHGQAVNPRGSLDLRGPRFPGAPDHDIL